MKNADICKFHKKNQMGYLQWHAWAAEQEKKKIKQIRCQQCEHYFYPEEFGSAQDEYFKNLKQGK